MPSHLQMHQLQRQTYGRWQQVPLLETQIQSQMVLKESSKSQGNQGQLNLSSCRQYQSMIRHNIKIFSQNIRKNKVLTDIILETQKNSANIIFIQESPRFLVWHIPSHSNPMRDPLYGTPNHPEWTLFICQDPTQENYTRVATYVNKHLVRMRFALRLNIINHHNINVLAFHNDWDTNYIINIYSDSNQTALQVLWQNMANIDNAIILTGDFNIRDSDWDLVSDITLLILTTLLLLQIA